MGEFLAGDATRDGDGGEGEKGGVVVVERRGRGGDRGMSCGDRRVRMLDLKAWDKTTEVNKDRVVKDYNRDGKIWWKGKKVNVSI